MKITWQKDNVAGITIFLGEKQCKGKKGGKRRKEKKKKENKNIEEI